MKKEKDFLENGYVKVKLDHVIKKHWLTLYNDSEQNNIHRGTFHEFCTLHKYKSFFVEPKFKIQSWIVVFPTQNTYIKVYELTKVMWDDGKDEEEIMLNHFNVNLQNFSWVQLTSKPELKVMYK